MPTAAIALGSNLGDTFYNLELALRLLEAPREVLNLGAETSHVDASQGDSNLTVAVVNTSFLYESAPMYVTDQPPFINCACMIETTLPPLTLLRLLKIIESTVGRVPSIRNGPRAVDLDIVFYDSDTIDTRPPTQRTNLENLQGELVIPHPRLLEREFVLRPLYDMIPDYLHPVCQLSIRTLLERLLPGDPPMKKVIPFPRYPSSPGQHPDHPFVHPVPPTLTHWTLSITTGPFASRPHRKTQHKTRLMATLNTTPDSFSDGSTHNTLRTALAYAKDSVAVGASIVDVGGYSTRPGAAFVGTDEEVNRVVPVVEAIRGTEEDKRLREVPISVDTFRPEVARAAILAGANCINDVYAFTGQDSYPYPTRLNEGDMRRMDECMVKMKSIAREFAVPVVLMHSRGEAGKNKDYDEYEYASTSVIEGVRMELGEKVDRIVKGKGGVRRWFVIVDPGIGFSKTLEGNLEVLRDAGAIRADVDIGDESNGTRKRNPLAGYPMLIGASKKSFLGVLLAQGDDGRTTEPKERGWATAAAVACAVQQGAEIVRVHDTKEMADVVTVADALWHC